ncbi:aminotransferase class I/II-fold pyridoxal phosphate-dependent enzyme [Schaalia vaccimaxillae]|uniref:aminotransferase class I/II-fold pyridoxal phosphate-dependent enzyme n=1 Tax=Schaalia vaccimaxillae TaxID=183916 RepID=UPI0004047B36
MTRLAQRALDFQPFHAMAIAAEANARRAQGQDIIKLSLGEPDSGAPQPVINALRELADGRPLPYTDALGLPQLRQAIADRYRDIHGAQISPRRVCITAGASAALLLVSAALVNPGDHVMLGDPSYPCNRQFLSTFGAHVDLVETSPHTRYQLDSTLVRDHWTEDTRGVLIASPSNPTGTRVPIDELDKICRFAREQGAWRVIDEIYLDLSDDLADGTRPPQCVNG